jgi:hypothetical protein
MAGVHVADPQSLNRYSYASNNPVSLVDPSGHDNRWGESSPNSGSADQDALDTAAEGVPIARGSELALDNGEQGASPSASDDGDATSDTPSDSIPTAGIDAVSGAVDTTGSVLARAADDLADAAAAAGHDPLPLELPIESGLRARAGDVAATVLRTGADWVETAGEWGGTSLGIVSSGVTGVTAAQAQYAADSVQNPAMDQTTLVSRAAETGIIAGGGSFAGGALGMENGAILGSVAGPGGTIVGGVAGAVFGAWGGEHGATIVVNIVNRTLWGDDPLHLLPNPRYVVA